MPEELAPPPDIQIAADATPESVFSAFAQLDPQRFPQHQEPAKQEQPKDDPVIVKTEPKQEAKSEVPESLLGLPAEEKKAEDDFDSMVAKEPEGQIKHDHYKRLKAAASKKVESLTAELQQTKAKYEEASKRGVPEEVQKQLDEYKKLVAEREAALERVAVEKSPKFQQQFTVKEVALQERIKRTATEFGLDAEAIAAAIHSSPKRRAELMDSLETSDFARSSLANMMVQHDMLQDEKQQFLSQSREVLQREAAEQAEAQKQQEAQRTAHEEKVFAEVGERMRKTFAPFQRVEGNEDWNQGSEALEAEAKKYFNGQLPLENLAEVVYKGVGAQRIELINAELHKRLQAATAELAELKKAQPGANGHQPSVNGKRPESSDPRQRAEDTFNRFVSEAQPMNGGF